MSSANIRPTKLQDADQIWATADSFIGRLSEAMDHFDTRTGTGARKAQLVLHARAACQAVKEGREGWALLQLLEVAEYRAIACETGCPVPSVADDAVGWLRSHLTSRLDER